jgi:hypothetical protein
VEAFLLCLFGGLLVATGLQRAGGKDVSRVLPIVSSLGAGLLTAWYYSQVSDRVNTVDSDVAVASIGIGLWVAVGGSIVGFLVGIRSPEQRWI